jgi:Glycosyl hydrolase family 12
MKKYLLTLLAVAILLIGGKAEIQTLAVASARIDSSISGKFETIAAAPYYMMNNIWNADSPGTRQQTSYFKNINNWGVTAKHITGAGKIKSYPAVVLGTHYNTSSGTSLLPQQIGRLQTVRSWWRQKSWATKYDAAYDLWFDPIASIGNRPARDELMIWLNWRSTNPIAGRGYDRLGAPIADDRRRIGNATWNIYHGSTGMNNVTSFLPTTKIDNININIRPLMDYCIEKGWLESSEYLTSIQAGWEITSGGTFRTTEYGVSLGSSQ